MWFALQTGVDEAPCIEQFSGLSDLYQPFKIAHDAMITSPQSLSSAPDFDPSLITCLCMSLCKQLRGSADVSSLFIQLFVGAIGDNVYISLYFQRYGQKLIH